MLVDYVQDRYAAENGRYIGFYTEDAKTVQYRYQLEEYESYVSEYDYNSRVYYNTLSEDARRIYHFFEYAMDHGYSNICLDVRLLPGEISPEDILYYLSLDSAVMEQNITRGDQNFTKTLTYDALIDYEVTVEFYHIHVSNFTEEHLAKKKLAIAEAEAVVSAMPEGLSDSEKALYLFDYLGKQVSYYTTDDPDADYSQRHFLYEALIEKKTNCDGYANAFSLMCDMAGIPCFEKLYTPENGSDEVGHTWTCVQLDGVWYNVDPTASPNIRKETWYSDIRFRFGYSDKRQENPPAYSDALPPCEVDRIAADLTFSSTADKGVTDAIGRALTALPVGDRLCVDFTYCDDDELDTVMQAVCDTYHVDTSRVGYETLNGGTVWFIIQR